MLPHCATALLIAVVLLNSGSMAFAQQALERQCLTQGNPAQIQTCSALIDPGRGNLFAYHVSRGSALLPKQDCDGASPISTRRYGCGRVASAAGSATGARSLSQNLGKDRGLASIRIDHSTLVFVAAKEGKAALDGDGDDSPFAVAMIEPLATPRAEINTLFRLVRDDVMEATAGRQEPHVYGSLPEREQFYLSRQMTIWSGVAAAVFCASKLANGGGEGGSCDAAGETDTRP